MTFYHDLVTEKSWEELKNLHTICNFTLLGGWAVYLYTHGLKSKDIDILVDYTELPKLRARYHFYKNDRLHKYEAVTGPVQIDIYTPHYSSIGIPIETLLTHTQTVDGFKVVTPDYLILLKLITLHARGRTGKGLKDFLDLISLFVSLKDQPFTKAVKLAKEIMPNNQILQFFQIILSEHTSLPELNLTTNQFSRLKKSLLQSLI